MPTKKAAASTPRKSARSGNPALRASSVKDFKRKNGRAKGLITLPSGMTAQVVNKGMRAFMTAGVVPNSLMGIVEESLDKGRPPEMADIQEEMNPEMVDDMYQLMDACCVMCFVEPQVLAAPEDESDRDDDKLYVDELDDEDKMFLFQWVTGGTRDVEQFRGELSDDLASVHGSKGVGRSTKRASRSRKSG